MFIKPNTRNLIRTLILSFLFFSLWSITGYGQNNKESRVLIDKENLAFGIGETLTYDIEFGIFNLGEGYSKVYKKQSEIDGKMYYHAIIKGWTKGMASWFANVDDLWGVYFDKDSLLPVKSYRKVKENSYRLQETTIFDLENKIATTSQRKKSSDPFKVIGKYPFKDSIPPAELISGFIHLRQFDFDNLQPYDTVSVPSFFENKYYKLEVVYHGTEVIDTRIGDVKAHILVPIMPDNSVFSGKNAIKGWLSADKNKIPLKFKAHLYIGNAVMQIKKYKNLRHPFDALVEE